MNDGHVSWRTLRGRRCLVVVFPENLTEEESRAILDELLAHVGGSTEPVHMVWDCRKMSAYSPMTFAAWRQELQSVRADLQEICCITSSPFIRLGARALGMALRLDVHPCSSEDDVSWA